MAKFFRRKSRRSERRQALPIRVRIIPESMSMSTSTESLWVDPEIELRILMDSLQDTELSPLPVVEMRLHSNGERTSMRTTPAKKASQELSSSQRLSV